MVELKVQVVGQPCAVYPHFVNTFSLITVKEVSVVIVKCLKFKTNLLFSFLAESLIEKY